MEEGKVGRVEITYLGLIIVESSPVHTLLPKCWLFSSSFTLTLPIKQPLYYEVPLWTTEYSIVYITPFHTLKLGAILTNWAIKYFDPFWYYTFAPSRVLAHHVNIFSILFNFAYFLEISTSNSNFLFHMGQIWTNSQNGESKISFRKRNEAEISGNNRTDLRS